MKVMINHVISVKGHNRLPIMSNQTAAKFVIPTKRAPAIILTQESLDILEKFPPCLSKEIKRYFKDGIVSSPQLKFIGEAQAVYDAMVDEIRVSLPKGKLEQTMIGTYRDAKQAPCLSYWRECNPEMGCGIDAVCRELKEKGWQPSVHLGRPIRNTDRKYQGGTYLYIRCDFS